jgi:hypothetical protein
MVGKPRFVGRSEVSTAADSLRAIRDASGDMSDLRASLGERCLDVEGLWVEDL